MNQHMLSQGGESLKSDLVLPQGAEPVFPQIMEPRGTGSALLSVAPEEQRDSDAPYGSQLNADPNSTLSEGAEAVSGTKALLES